MRIRDFHRYEVYSIICIMVYLAGLYVWYAIKKGIDSNFYFLCAILVIGCILFTYVVAYELKSYFVNEEGITVEWFAWKHFFSWSELKYIRLETVYAYSKSISVEHNSIVCSKIPIKKRLLERDDGINYRVIDYEWLLRRPNKVFAIDLKFFKEGQLEEFWSYVPERLKK